MVNPRILTRGEKDALKRLDAGDWRRVPGGYACPGATKITFALAERLICSGLARSQLDRGIPKLKITDLGRATLDRMKPTAEASA